MHRTCAPSPCACAPTATPRSSRRRVRSSWPCRPRASRPWRVNLLTRQEAQRDPDAPYNIPRLTERILAATEWAAHQPPLAALTLAVVASDTGCAAAIRAAVKAPETFTAIACLGGRADLAGAEPLRAVRTPVRMIITPGTTEAGILERAYPLMKGKHHWLVLPATDDARELEQLAARAAATWLRQHLPQVEGSPQA